MAKVNREKEERMVAQRARTWLFITNYPNGSDFRAREPELLSLVVSAVISGAFGFLGKERRITGARRVCTCACVEPCDR